MEQELTNQLNKKIIEQFMDTHNDIRTKIDALNRLKENTKLDDDLTSRMNKTINDLNVACIKLEDQINIMNEKAKKGISLFSGTKSILEDTKYEDKNTKLEEKLDSTKEKIEQYNNMIGTINTLGNGKIVTSIKNSLEKRVEALKKKQGRIQNKQSKIIDKATNNKINSYLNRTRFNKKTMAILMANEKNNIKNNSKIDELQAKKEELDKIKQTLNANSDLLFKGLGAKVAVDEVALNARLNALKAKKGILEFGGRKLILSSVQPDLITKMKNKAKGFGSSLRAGIEAYKIAQEEAKRTYATR